jgi:N-dimethylarginine dimethylaminohydrolase
MTKPRILMCPPDFYGIEYEINPWMNRARPADHERAVRQWNDLFRILEEAGANISQLTPEPGLPDLVFTANAGLVFHDRVIPARFRPEQRRKEEPIDEAWFAGAGFRVLAPPEDTFFEGAGDALFCGDTLFAGYRIRSDARSHQQIGALLGVRVIPLELVDSYFYHLDTCFCPLDTDSAAYFPGALDQYARGAVNELIDDLIEVDEDEARRFACNAVVVGRTVVTNSACPRFHAALGERGFHAIETPLGEFVKSGGSAKCLTLRLDGEDAAAWRR